MKLYIVQAEEGSGIPGVPEVYLTQEEANAAYDDAWREALDLGKDEELPPDFEDDWPDDGGVRMWVEEVAGIELEPGDCSECGDPFDDHQWHTDLTHTYN